MGLLDDGLSSGAASARAKDLRPRNSSHHRSFFKMAVPLIVILPGLIGLAVLPEKLVPESALQPGQHITMMCCR